VRYHLALILTLMVLGKVAGMTTPAGVAQWVRLRAGWLSEVLPCTRESFPCATTYSNILREVDAEQVRQMINDWLTRVQASTRCGEEPSRLLWQEEQREEHVHVALDGKTRRRHLRPCTPRSEKDASVDPL